MLKRVVRSLWQHWLAGALILLAGCGYVFYALLWGLRYMQRHIAVTVVVLVLIAAGAGLLAWRCLIGQSGGAPVEAVVGKGEALSKVASHLRDQGVVCSGRALVVLMKVQKSDRAVQAGLHRFTRGGGLLRAAKALQHAIVIESPMTVPEGLTVEQIAGVVSSTYHVDSARFVAVCSDSARVAGYGFTAPTLEGYLFPDTYRFAETVTVEQIVERMVARFREEYAKIRVDSSVAASLTMHEIVTLAAIVEKEATLAEERGRIAGVFHNRLRLGYPLGADPTVRYFLRKFNGPLRVSELANRNPYNTRVHKGLPPGPICSPGAAALAAAAAPEQTKDLYFVAVWDGTGAHDFSRTLAEHERKKLDIRHKNEERLSGSKKGKGT